MGALSIGARILGSVRQKMSNSFSKGLSGHISSFFIVNGKFLGFLKYNLEYVKKYHLDHMIFFSFFGSKKAYDFLNLNMS